MNRTSNYDLCQWEETDRVRRTDFNEDNAKIDQALAQERAAREALNGRVTEVSERAGAKLLKSVPPLGQGVTPYIISFEGIDWSQWKKVYLVLNLPSDPVHYGHSPTSSRGLFSNGRHVIIYYPMFSAEDLAAGHDVLAIGSQAFVSTGENYKGFTKMYLFKENSSAPLHPNICYQIWAEK